MCDIFFSYSGQIDATELKEALKSGGLSFSDSTLKRLLNLNHHSQPPKTSVNFDEFVVLSSFLEGVAATFHKADRSKDGKVMSHLAYTTLFAQLEY